MENLTFVYNVSMELPKECSSINISLFTSFNKSVIKNVNILGQIHILNTKKFYDVKYGLSEGTDLGESTVFSGLDVFITGGTVPVKDHLASYDNLPEMEDRTIFDKFKINYERGG